MKEQSSLDGVLIVRIDACHSETRGIVCMKEESHIANLSTFVINVHRLNVLAQHAFGAEARDERPHRGFDALHPAERDAIGVAIVK